MKISLKEMSWPLQLALAMGLGAAVLAAGEFAPAPFPLSSLRHQLVGARNLNRQLVEQLASLKGFEKRHAELRSAITASRVQLSLLQQALPENQELDLFIMQLQHAAVAAGISIRRITARPVVPREDHYEMPFELEIDGPYYGVEQFFHQLSLVPRIITVGDLKIDGLAQPAKFPTAPGATVTGTLAVRTFFQGKPQPPAASRAQKKGTARR